LSGIPLSADAKPPELLEKQKPPCGGFGPRHRGSEGGYAKRTSRFSSEQG
jgi:hypothetical protein